ncbi:hypothetical protein HaLaN_33096, partial [Haematococcus lacustris]
MSYGRSNRDRSLFYLSAPAEGGNSLQQTSSSGSARETVGAQPAAPAAASTAVRPAASAAAPSAPAATLVAARPATPAAASTA